MDNLIKNIFGLIFDFLLYIIFYILHYIFKFFEQIGKLLYKFVFKYIVLLAKKIIYLIKKPFKMLYVKINNFIYDHSKPRQRKKPKKLKRKKESTGYLFVLPWIIGILVFAAFPIYKAITYSFELVKITNNGVVSIPVGFENYIDVLVVNQAYVNMLTEVAKELIIQIPIVIVISIFLAVLLTSQVKGIGIFRVMFFVPVIILSGPVVQLLTEIGIINSTSELFSDVGIDFFIINIVVYLLQNITLILWYCGIPIIVFMIMIQRINPDLYEAGDMDGASGWDKFWKITLPELKMGINISILYLVVFIGNFSTNPVIIELKKNMFDPVRGLGYTSAQALVYTLELIVIIIFLLLIVNGIPKKKQKVSLVGVVQDKPKRKLFKKMKRGDKNEQI